MKNDLSCLVCLACEFQNVPNILCAENSRGLFGALRSFFGVLGEELALKNELKWNTVILSLGHSKSSAVTRTGPEAAVEAVVTLVDKHCVSTARLAVL